MKVLVAGATGAIGRPLCRRLRAAGHEVLGTTRTTNGAAVLSAAGVTPVVVDAMDRRELLRSVQGLRADAVVHELTALSKPPTRHRGMRETNLLRTVGTENLLAAARQMKATRFVTQSIVFGYGYSNHRQRVLDEDSPFGRASGNRCDQHVRAMHTNERLVLGATDLAGISLRYGIFYGADVSARRDLLNARKIPVPAKVDRPLPWIHIDDAASATVAALEIGGAGEAYNIVDDDTTSWGQMFTDMAAVLGAPAPKALPSWVIRMAAPYVAAMTLDTSMHVSNGKAKRELDWALEHATHMDGLRSVASDQAA